MFKSIPARRSEKHECECECCVCKSVFPSRCLCRCLSLSLFLSLASLSLSLPLPPPFSLSLSLSLSLFQDSKLIGHGQKGSDSSAGEVPLLFVLTFNLPGANLGNFAPGSHDIVTFVFSSHPRVLRSGPTIRRWGIDFL